MLLPYATRAAVMSFRATSADGDIEATCDRTASSFIRFS